MKRRNATPNESEFVHDALDWFTADYCEDHIVFKIVHNHGSFDVVCSDRHGINIIFSDTKLIPAVEFYAEFKETKPEAIVDFLAGNFGDEATVDAEQYFASISKKKT